LLLERPIEEPTARIAPVGHLWHVPKVNIRVRECGKSVDICLLRRG